MVQLADVLKAVGPNASIIFAAWIFMGFLQQRYDNAVDRYRISVGDYRANDHEDVRKGNLREQILLLRRRCKLMAWSVLSGLTAAILLIVSVIFGAVDVIVPNVSLIGIGGTFTAIAGLVLVIVAASFVIAEGRIVGRQIDDELRDVGDLAQETGTQPRQ
jgi:hypothetical protein